MSFNAKNLEYEVKEPSFLRKMKSDFGGRSGRLERPAPLPRKQKDNDDDDGPTYVLEESNEVLSKEQYKALMGEDGGKGDEHPAQVQPGQGVSTSETGEEGKTTEGAETRTSMPKQHVAEIGGPKKRKQVKVVGDGNTAENEQGKSQEPVSRKPKQKKKKIKLSFDDET